MDRYLCATLYTYLSINLLLLYGQSDWFVLLPITILIINIFSDDVIKTFSLLPSISSMVWKTAISPKMAF